MSFYIKMSFAASIRATETRVLLCPKNCRLPMKKILFKRSLDVWLRLKIGCVVRSHFSSLLAHFKDTGSSRTWAVRSSESTRARQPTSAKTSLLLLANPNYIEGMGLVNSNHVLRFTIRGAKPQRSHTTTNFFVLFIFLLPYSPFRVNWGPCFAEHLGQSAFSSQ